MGQDIHWCEVRWKRLASYRDPERRLKAVNRAIWTRWLPLRWMRPFSISSGWRSLHESYNAFLYLDSALARNGPELYARLHREFPILLDVGVLWDTEKCRPKIPTDLPGDEGGHLVASLSPGRVAQVLQGLKAIDRDSLRALIQAAVEANAVDKIFESGDEFISFIDAITQGFEKAAAKRRGLLVLLSY